MKKKILFLVQDFDKDTSVGPQFTSLLTTSGNTVSLLSVKAIETCIILSTMGITKKICFEKSSLNKPAAKGQLISKCLFGGFTFFQKTNGNKSTRSKVEFICSSFGRNVRLKKSFWIYHYASPDSNQSKLLARFSKLIKDMPKCLFHKKYSCHLVLSIRLYLCL